MLYPLKFNPIYKEKIWGGEKIRTVLKKDFRPMKNCGESWEVSGVKGDISIVREGDLAGKNLLELIKEFKGDLIGNRVYSKYKENFPLLIKFIDANEDLSIQVHPNDILARERHDSFGKTEMWYVIQADTGAGLIAGFNKPITPDKYLEVIEKGKFEEILNKENVEKGNVYFIPAGRIHTIGKGLLVAEIQQTSDVTYRIYDFDRKDDQGNKRELHIEESVDAIDYKYLETYKTKYTNKINEVVALASCEYFTTNKLILTETLHRDYRDLDSFAVIICLEGEGTIIYQDKQMPLTLGETVLIPSSFDKFSINPNGKIELLETFVTKA